MSLSYKKARNIWRNNFPKMMNHGYAIIGGLSHKKYTMPRFHSNLFYYDINKINKEKEDENTNK